MSNPLLGQVFATESARAGAHEAFLRTSGGIGQALARQMAFQMELIERLADAGEGNGFVPTWPENEPIYHKMVRPRRSIEASAWNSPSGGSATSSARSSPRSTPIRPGSGSPTSP